MIHPDRRLGSILIRQNCPTEKNQMDLAKPGSTTQHARQPLCKGVRRTLFCADGTAIGWSERAPATRPEAAIPPRP